MRNIIPMELTDLNSSIDMAVRPTYGGLPKYGVASGDIASFITNINYPLKKLEADIKAVQDFNGYDYPWAGGAGKNLCPQVVPSTTSGDVVFIPQADGTVKVNGTTTNTYSTPTQQLNLKAGTYIITCVIPSGHPATTGLQVNGAGVAGDGGSQTVTLATDGTITLNYRVSSGVTINNEVWKPMVRLSGTTDTWEPYSNICPISGWDEVNVTRTGKNLVEQVMDGYVSPSGSNGIWDLASPTGQKSVVFYCMAGKSYTISGILADRCVYAIFDSIPTTSGTVGHNAENLSSGITIPKTITPQASGYCVVYLATSSAIDTSNVQIELGSTATAYEPYNGQTYTIDLDGTRYGGTLDVTTGVLTIDKGYVDLSEMTWTRRRAYTFSTSLADYCNNAVPISEHFSDMFNVVYAAGYSGVQHDSIGIYCTSSPTGSTGTIYFRCSNIEQDSVSGLTAWFANNKPHLVYELAEPQVVQLTPTEVTTLLGQNNIWADSGQVYVEYHFVEDFEE